MAQKKHNEVLVGITVLLVLILTFYIVVVLAEWPGAYEPQQEITVQLPYKAGLRGLQTGSPIYLGGTKVGQVTETSIAYLNSEKDVFVSFTLKIPRQYPLRHDCVLIPESNVLGGQTILVIEDLGCRGEPVPDGATVKLKLGNSMTEAIKREFDPDNPDSLMAQLKFEVDRKNDSSIIASLAHTAANLRQITAKIEQQFTLDEQKLTMMAKVHSILNNLGNITDRVNTQLDTDNKAAVIARLQSALDKLDDNLTQIKETIQTNKENVTQIVTSLKNTAQTLEKDIPEITSRIRQTLVKVDASVDTARITIQNLRQFSDQARDVAVVNRDNINQLINNITEVSSNLKLTSREVRRAPWKLLYKPGKEQLKIQGLIDSAGAFASGAERLDNAALRLRSILTTTGEKIPLDKQIIDSILAELEISFGQFQKAEQKFWDELPG
jgi:ABC-type transporter Mla subunit MlaD